MIRVRKWGAASFFLFLIAVSTQANKKVKITVSAEPNRIHTYEGLGTSLLTPHYSNFAKETRMEMAGMLFGLPGFKYLRLWANTDYQNDAYRFYKERGLQYEDAKEVRRNMINTGLIPESDTLILLMGPGGKVGDLRPYAKYYAWLISELQNKYGMVTDVTGIANEPNNHDILKAEQVPVLVKYFREELDSVGLEHVKIIAPETSNLDQIAWDMTEAIMNDPEAMDALWGFSTHSYNMCVTELYGRYIQQSGKKYWQTESSENGPEDYNDSIRAVQALARCVSDINLGVNVWIFFVGYFDYWDQDNAIKIIVWHSDRGEYRPLLKYFYFRQFCYTFDVGAEMRFCYTDLPVRPGGSHADVYMENTYGLKPPLCAAAGQNPKGDWSFTLTNMTGVYSSWAGSQYYPYQAYDVTFQAEELVAAAPEKYLVMRCNDGTRNVIVDTVTMQDGAFTVTINPMDLLSIRKSFESNIPYPEYREFAPAEDYGPCGMGVGFAFIPPMGFSAAGLYRRCKRKKKRLRDSSV